MNSNIYWSQINKIAEGIEAVINDGQFVEHVIKQKTSFQEQGSKDRKIIASALFEIIKNFRKYCFLAEVPETDLEGHHTLSLIATYLAVNQINVRGQSALPAIDKDHLAQRLDAIKQYPAVQYSVPDWLYILGLDYWKDKWHVILETSLGKAPVFLRVNTLKTNIHKLSQYFTNHHLEHSLLPPATIMLHGRIDLTRDKAWLDGHFEIQDKGSQQIALFGNPKPQMTIIDSCAGAGGKTLHLAALMQNKGQIYALDVNAQALKQLEHRSQRAGTNNIKILVHDGAASSKWPTPQADLILCDVPCTGTGVMRREIDKKRSLTENDLKQLVDIQFEILKNATNYVKSGGFLVYATCSILPQENENQIERFLSEHPQFTRLNQNLLVPEKDGHDGFFMCLLQKKK